MKTLSERKQEGDKFMGAVAKNPVPQMVSPAAQAGPPDENETIARAKQGDAAAFERLYGAHCKHVYGLCLRMLRNPAEAEDLTQQIFLQLFRKIGTFRGDSSFSTWLHRISVNAVLMHLRRNRQGESPVKSLDDQGTRGADQIEKASLPGIIDRLNLKRAIRSLPAGYKRFFLLHDVFGYRHTEIATLLGCSIGCSKSQLHKARKSLRRLLQGEAVGNNGSRERPGPPQNDDKSGIAAVAANPWEKSAAEYFSAGPICVTPS